jgi:hypothetical protein
MNDKTFADYEREGWQRNAADYDTIDLPATRQAIAPLLTMWGIYTAAVCWRSPRAPST